MTETERQQAVFCSGREWQNLAGIPGNGTEYYAILAGMGASKYSLTI